MNRWFVRVFPCAYGGAGIGMNFDSEIGPIIGITVGIMFASWDVISENKEKKRGYC